MLRKRLIFTLIYADGYFHQSRNFRLQKVGDLQWLEKNYKFPQIAFSLDEIIVLNASKDIKNMLEFAEVVNKLVNNVFLPVSAGGGIRTMEDAELLFKNGADKIVVNSTLETQKELITSLVKKHGGQSILASIDCKKGDYGYEVYINNGDKKLNKTINTYLSQIENLGIGEIYLNSIDRDGTGFGYDEGLLKEVKDLINLPLIIAGGAGNETHFERVLNLEYVSAVATANLFNFIGNGLPNARKKLLQQQYNFAKW